MRVVLVAVAALLFSGCASSPAADADDAAPADGSLPAVLAAAQVPLRFSVGDFESITTYTKTFQPTDICFPQCQGNAMQVIDLTEVVPADAPVELAVTIESNGGVNGDLVYTDAEPVQQSQSNSQGGSTLSAIVVRAATGTVELHLFHGFFFNGLPNTQPTTANVEVRSVVRADTLVAGIPAAVRLEPGAVLNFTGADLEQAVLISSTGAILRDVDGPFTLTVPNGTAGDSIVMVYGGSAQVHGPNVTMIARRVSVIETAPKDIASGADTKLSFTTDTAPLLVGVILESKETAAFVSAASFVGEYSVKITAPGNVVVVDETPNCQIAFCEMGFLIFGSGFAYYESGYLDEHLRAGAYEVSVQAQQANNFQAYAFYLVIL